MAMSTPRSAQGSSAGSRNVSFAIRVPLTVIESSADSTPPANGPSTESYFRRCAIVFVSPMSLTATMSKSPPRCDVRTQEVPSDAAEAVDAYACLGHVLSLSPCQFAQASPACAGRPPCSRGARTSPPARETTARDASRRSAAISWSSPGRDASSPRSSSSSTARSWPCAARARAHEVRVVGVREPVRRRARRADDRVLVDGERGVAGSGQRERVGDRLRAAGERDRVGAPLSCAEEDVLLRRDANEELGAVELREPHLELGRPRAADRSRRRAALRARTPHGSRVSRRPWRAVASAGGRHGRRCRPRAAPPPCAGLRGRAAGSA